MAGKGKREEEDDGRVIADMSDVGRPAWILPKRNPEQDPERYPPRSQKESGVKKNPWEGEEDLLNPEERRMYMLGALKAALLIALAFIAGLGAVILGLLALWS